MNDGRGRTPSRRRLRWLIAAPWVLFALQPLPALGHGDDGAMDILSSMQVGENVIVLEVSVPYADDGDLAAGATVTAIATGPAGRVLRAVELQATPQQSYRAELHVPAPGSWRILLTSVDPAAEATVDVTVVRRATTAANPPAAAGGGHADGSTLVPAVAVAVVAVGAAGITVLKRRARRLRSRVGG